MNYTLSAHAVQRCGERGISSDDVRFILDHAHRVYRTGVIFYQMRKKNMPQLAGNDRFHRLVGVTVIVCPCGCFVVTVYKNPEAYKKDRRKPKYNLRNGSESCPNCSEQAFAA